MVRQPICHIKFFQVLSVCGWSIIGGTFHEWSDRYRCSSWRDGRWRRDSSSWRCSWLRVRSRRSVRSRREGGEKSKRQRESGWRLRHLRLDGVYFIRRFSCSWFVLIQSIVLFRQLHQQYEYIDISSHHNYRYTVCQKTWHQTFFHVFTKYWPIFKIASLEHSVENSE